MAQKQTTTPADAFEAWLAQVLDPTEPVSDQVYEQLYFLYQHPLNLNKASEEDLRGLYLLTEYQITQLLAHRQKYGRLVSVYELQAIPGFDGPTVLHLLPLVKVPETDATDPTLPWHRKLGNSPTHWVLARYTQQVELARGYQPHMLATDSAGYQGSPPQLLLRYLARHPGKHSIGFTAEKDAGEPLDWQPQQRLYGMDFYSGHIAVYGQAGLKMALVGDYYGQFGQGLVMGRGFQLGKGAETITTVRQPRLGIRPYTAVGEQAFLRGAAATVQQGQVEATLFASHRRHDATLEPQGTGQAVITALPLSGLHRTHSEAARRSAVTANTAGANLHYRHPAKRLQLGVNALAMRYSHPFAQAAQWATSNTPPGHNRWNASVYSSGTVASLHLFAEAAASANGGFGAVAGLMSSLTPALQLAMLWRHYNNTFDNPHGHAFAEGTRNQNEQGMYWGLKYTLKRRLTLSAFYDQFKFPWLRYRVNGPSNGYEWMVKAVVHKSKLEALTVQLRSEHKMRNANTTNATQATPPQPATRHNWTLQYQYVPYKPLTFKTRLQGSRYAFEQQVSMGYALIQDVTYKTIRWQLSARAALFDTDNFDTRQYAYERDVLYAFTIPAYSGQGIRTMVMAKVKISKTIMVWARYASTLYNDRTEVGSGNDLVAGRRRSQVKLQVRFSL